MMVRRDGAKRGRGDLLNPYVSRHAPPEAVSHIRFAARAMPRLKRPPEGGKNARLGPRRASRRVRGKRGVRADAFGRRRAIARAAARAHRPRRLTKSTFRARLGPTRVSCGPEGNGGRRPLPRRALASNFFRTRRPPARLVAGDPPHHRLLRGTVRFCTPFGRFGCPFVRFAVVAPVLGATVELPLSGARAVSAGDRDSLPRK